MQIPVTPHREMETANIRPRLTHGTQNLRIRMAASAPELNLAAGHQADLA
jgi:hypothetical protein